MLKFHQKIAHWLFGRDYVLQEYFDYYSYMKDSFSWGGTLGFYNKNDEELLKENFKSLRLMEIYKDKENKVWLRSTVSGSLHGPITRDDQSIVSWLTCKKEKYFPKD